MKSIYLYLNHRNSTTTDQTCDSLVGHLSDLFEKRVTKLMHFEQTKL